jgi:rRNA maturation endonuclease Nob1
MLVVYQLHLLLLHPTAALLRKASHLNDPQMDVEMVLITQSVGLARKSCKIATKDMFIQNIAYTMGLPFSVLPTFTVKIQVEYNHCHMF